MGLNRNDYCLKHFHRYVFSLNNNSLLSSLFIIKFYYILKININLKNKYTAFINEIFFISLQIYVNHYMKLNIY